MAKKVLVTGGAGFIGSFIVDELLKKGYEVRIFDCIDPQVHPEGKVPEHLNRNAEFVKGDVRNYDEFKKALKGVNIVSHHAAAVGVGQSQYKINYYVDTNVTGTANLLDIVVNTKNSIEKITVAASMSSYGEGNYNCKKCGVVNPPLRTEGQVSSGDWELVCPKCKGLLKPIPTDESKFQQCNSIYALTKKMQEDMVLNIAMTYKLPSVVLRYFNVYGPRQSLSNPYTGVTAIFMSRIKNNQPPVVYEDGLQTRDFISVHDIARANITAIENEKADYKSFNVGTGNPMAIKVVAEELAKYYGKEIKPDITKKFRKGDVRHCYSDNSLIEKTLGFKPETSFEAGMRELMGWAEKAYFEDRFEDAARELKEKGLV
ncbi:MAG: nucleoside-diphosphate-sugar epimerase [Candidatus Schekmanbacteria bacterium GWA2_38_11]|uniref:Nucleoside-diphosphate-sugar epimerase n=1 Tax=Candidatus Schekmanbacteria bacterium GWA2_38_11 TaxID=1817876 RepID=A0A1F7RME8_9BACT|nr:MAG: nucleoside-diphosphate-sugar epimerase [Candidatus Schekmanbacteria bacterium GWA2_38_11]